jgi:hypothetical protein
MFDDIVKLFSPSSSFSSKSNKHNAKELAQRMMRRISAHKNRQIGEKNKEVFVNDLFAKYKAKYGSAEYLDYVANDIPILIGFYIDLERTGDQEGMQLVNDINHYIAPNDNSNPHRIRKMLMAMPFLLLYTMMGFQTV